MFRAVAIDPLALILSSSVYVRLTLPDPPPPEVLRELVENLSAEERKLATARVKALGAFAKAAEKALAR
jgi:hypothetical protein